MASFTLVLILIKRLRSQIGLTLVLVASVALALGIVTCVPMFADAVSRRIMQEELGAASKFAPQSSIVVRFYASPSPSRPLGISDADVARAWLADMLTRRVRIPIQAVYTEVHSPRYQLITTTASSQATKDRIDGVYVIYAARVEEHVQILTGAPIFSQEGAGDTLSVWVNQRVAEKHALMVGDLFEFGDVYNTDIARVPIKIAGIWQVRDSKDEFWAYTEAIWDYENILPASRQGFETTMQPAVPSGSKFVSWRFALEGRKMNLSRAERYIQDFKFAQEQTEQRLAGGGMDQAPTEYLMRGQQRKDVLSLIFLGFSVPLIMIILYFMSAVSTILVRYQAQELATLTSRGSGRLQLLGLAVVETLLLLAIATPVGLALGLGLARLLGYSSSFLHFIPRTPLEVDLVSADWRLLGAVLLAALVARLAPTWPAIRLTIVTQEQRSARQQILLGSTRLLIIALLVLVTTYAYRKLAQTGTLAVVSWKPNDPAHDPLLLLAPSLFVLTGPFVLSEVFVLLMPLLAWIGRILPSVTAYLGFTSLGREGGQYRTPVYMLILCLSLGVFYASLAKSADAWLVERRHYEVGSDLTFRPRGMDESLAGGSVPTELVLAATQLPISDYDKLPGAEKAMPMGEYKASIVTGSIYTPGRLLAVDRLRAPQVVYYRPDYAAVPLGDLMNRLGGRWEGVLLPEDVAARLQLAEGDKLMMNVIIDKDKAYTFEFVLVGTFWYFPTMFPREGVAFVANLDYLQFQTSDLLAYGLWVRAAPDADIEELKQAVVSRSLGTLVPVGDLPTALAEDQLRLERVGLFGMLTVAFAAGALLAAVGLLVHVSAAMKKRGLRFAVLQTLGLARDKVMWTVFLEYVLVLVYSVVAGAALGIVCARMYVPFFQLIDTKGVPVPPYMVLIDNERAFMLAGAMAVTLVIVEGLILLRVLRARVFEVLRLGTRE